MSSYAIAIVINEKSGANLDGGADRFEQRLRTAVARLGRVVTVRHARGSDIAAVIDDLTGRDDVDMLVAAGGDGTISCAAARCAVTGKCLLPLPLGTYNLFCRSLGIPPEPDRAVTLIDDFVEDKVDVGRVNGEFFVHHVSAGLHPRFIAIRNALPYNSRIGKIVSSFNAFRRLLRGIPRRPVKITVDDEWSKAGRLAGVTVTVNRIAEEPGFTAVLDDPAGGRLTAYIITMRHAWQALLLAVRVFFGAKRAGRYLEVRSGETVTIEGRSRSISVSLDGERRRLRMPLEVRLVPAGLCVLRPKAAGAMTEPSA